MKLSRFLAWESVVGSGEQEVLLGCFYNLPGAGQVSAVTTKPAWAAAAAEVACCEAAEEAGVL